MYTPEKKAEQVRNTKNRLTELRAELLTVEKKVKELRRFDISMLAHNPLVDMSELAANITLAFRHCEDARMRLGKAIQALEGGVSIFDRPAS